MKKPAFDKEYYQTYGPGGSRDYAASWREFSFHPADILALYKALFASKPDTLLDIGAADGSLVGAFLEHGIEALGIENSAYIHGRIADKLLKTRIQLGDADTLIRQIPDNHFDIVIECAAQYMPRRKLLPYLKQVRRICANLCCLLVQFDDVDDEPHTGVQTFAGVAWWKSEMLKAGLKAVPGGDGFYYTRSKSPKS